MKKTTLFWLWIFMLMLLIYISFFQPQVYQHIFNYPGPGSPFINTP